MTAKKPESKSYIKISKKDMITISIRAKKDILKRYENDEKPVYFELINTKEDTGIGTLYFVDHNYDGHRFDATKEVCDKSADKIVNEVFEDFDPKPVKTVSVINVDELIAEPDESGKYDFTVNERLVSEIPLYESFYIGHVKFIKVANGKSNIKAVAIDDELNINGTTLTKYIRDNYRDSVTFNTAANHGIYSAVYGTDVPTDDPIFAVYDSDEGHR